MLRNRNALVWWTILSMMEHIPMTTNGTQSFSESSSAVRNSKPFVSDFTSKMFHVSEKYFCYNNTVTESELCATSNQNWKNKTKAKQKTALIHVRCK